MSVRILRRLIPHAVMVGLAACAGQTSAQYTWKSTTSSNWNNAANWTGGIPVSGATTTLTFGAGTYTATNDIATTPFELTGLTFGASGTATVADSGQGLELGGATPTVTMGAGNGTITPAITLAASATVAGGTGTLTLGGAVNDNGGGFNLTMASTGTLVLSGGGSFNQLLANAGTTTISGSTLAITQPDPGTRLPGIGIGENSGNTAVVNINGGATVSVTENIFIGDAAGSTGTLNVDGPGTTVNNTIGGQSGRLAVGNFGNGTLNITNGAQVTCANLFTPREPGTNTGTINVSGVGSALHVTTEASFCSNGFGTATFSKGATFDGGADLLLGVNPTGNGVVTFTDPGTSANITQLLVGYSAGATNCTLNILNGATLTATNAVFIALGSTANGGTGNSSGTINVSGAGSLLYVPDPVSNTIPQAFLNASTALIVGGGAALGTGTLNVTAGGAVVTSYLTIGNNEGASGIVNVSGPRTTLTSVGEADIGPGTTGGVVNAGVGTVVSFGPTYVWTSGVINVNTGTLGSFTLNGLYDGYDVGLGVSTGSVVVGASSTLVISPDGNNGGSTSPASFSGVISGAGGVTKTGPGTQVFTGGVNTFTGPLSLNGGVLVFGALADLGAGTAINFGGGTLQWAAGNKADISASTVTINARGATIDTNGNNVTFANGIGNNGAGGLTKAGLGTLILNPAPPTGGTVGYNSYLGATNVLNGTLSVPSDMALGVLNTGTAAAPVFVEGGSVTGAAAGTLLFTASTTTSRTFAMGGGTIAVAAGQTLTFAGSQVSGATLDGAGTFATDATAGAQFVSVTSSPLVTITSNSPADQFVHFINGGAFTVPSGVNPTGTSTTVNLNGFTNQGSGTVTVGTAPIAGVSQAPSQIKVSAFQSYGVLTLNPAPNTPANPQATEFTNVGASALFFNGGSRTFVGTPATATSGGQPTFVAGINLNGQNLVIAGGLFVNNGFVSDFSAIHGKIIVDYGSLYKGAGFTGVSIVTQNGGKVQAGNSPGSASYGNFVFGPGGVNNYVFAIDNAAGTAGPSPDASGLVSGWGLINAIKHSLGSTMSSGNFTWTATPSSPVTVAIDTLVNPTMVGTDVNGAMANFNPNGAYSWPAVEWTGTYSGPTNVAALDAGTHFDTSGFANPIAGTFGWSLDTGDQTLSLTYTPSAVPEPGTLALTALAGLGLVRSIRRRYFAVKIRGV